MKITRIKSTNFKQWKDVDIDLSGLKLVSIIGQYSDDKTRSNAAGKSTIGDLIKYALFEWMPNDLKPDDLISWGENRFELEMEFEFEGSIYKIRRAKQVGVGSVEFDLMIDGNRAGKNVVERRKILKEALGMGADVADATWFFLQKETNKLTSADPAERKEYLSTVLQSWKWQPVHDAAKSRLASIEAALDNAQKQQFMAEQLKVDLSKIDSDLYQAGLAIELNDMQVKRIRAQFDGNAKRITELQQLSASLTDAMKRINAESESANTRLSEAKARCNKIDENILLNRTGIGQCGTAIAITDERIRLIKSQWSSVGYPDLFLDAARIVSAKFRDGYNQALRNEADANRRAEMFAGGVCPTCNQKISDSHNSVESLKAEIADCQKISAISHGELVASAESEKLAELHWKELTTLESSKIQMSEKIEGGKVIELTMNESSAAVHSELNRLTTELNSIAARALEVSKKWMEINGDTVIEQCAGIEVEQQHLFYELTGFEKGRSELLMKIGSLQNSRKLMSQQFESIKDVGNNIPVMTKEVKVSKALVQMFSRDGLALVKTGMAATLIEHYTNELLQSILPEFHVAIAVDSTSARGSLNFQVSTPSGVKPYSVFSGGEKTIVDVCLRMALSRVLAEGVGKRYRTLFLDEVFAELDVRNREFMLALLKHLSKTFATIFVISHDREMQLSFPQILLVERTGRTSTARILENSHERETASSG